MSPGFYLDHMFQGLRFAEAKSMFAFFIEECSNRASSSGYDDVVEVHELPLQPCSQGSSDGSFSCAHEANKKNGLSFRQAVLGTRIVFRNQARTLLITNLPNSAAVHAIFSFRKPFADATKQLPEQLLVVMCAEHAWLISVASLR